MDADLRSFTTGGLLTESGRKDLVAFASCGVFISVIIVVLLPGRQLYASHRQRGMIPMERVLDLVEMRAFMLYAEERIPLELIAAERDTELVASDRELELIADEEITW